VTIRGSWNDFCCQIVAVDSRTVGHGEPRKFKGQTHAIPCPDLLSAGVRADIWREPV
jgi:hypothetical protein